MWTRRASGSTDDSTRPIIFLLSLDKQTFWDESYFGLIDLLTTKATVKEAVKTHFALHYLANNNPSAIIVTDPAIVCGEPSCLIADPVERNEALEALNAKVQEYVYKGGTVVLASHFSGFVSRDDLDRWFNCEWELPWKFGDYRRSTVYLNPISRLDQTANLPAEYSQKAVFLTNVPRDAAVYLPGVEESYGDLQAPVVFAKIGKGWLGYVGDVNPEVGSDAVVLAMCGL